MSNQEHAEAEILYTCDTCGKHFNSIEDAQIHNRNSHREGGMNYDSNTGLWTLAEGRQEGA